MTKKFDLKNFLTSHREDVFAKYEQLKKEPFFNGISLKDFMLRLYAIMQNNRVGSEKRAMDTLIFAMGEVYINCLQVETTIRNRDEALEKRYAGTKFEVLL